MFDEASGNRARNIYENKKNDASWLTYRESMRDNDLPYSLSI